MITKLTTVLVTAHMAFVMVLNVLAGDAGNYWTEFLTTTKEQYKIVFK